MRPPLSFLLHRARFRTSSLSRPHAFGVSGSLRGPSLREGDRRDRAREDVEKNMNQGKEERSSFEQNRRDGLPVFSKRRIHGCLSWPCRTNVNQPRMKTRRRGGPSLSLSLLFFFSPLFYSLTFSRPCYPCAPFQRLSGLADMLGVEAGKDLRARLSSPCSAPCPPSGGQANLGLVRSHRAGTPDGQLDKGKGRWRVGCRAVRRVWKAPGREFHLGRAVVFRQQVQLEILCPAADHRMID